MVPMGRIEEARAELTRAVHTLSDLEARDSVRHAYIDRAKLLTHIGQLEAARADLEVVRDSLSGSNPTGVPRTSLRLLRADVQLTIATGDRERLLMLRDSFARFQKTSSFSAPLSRTAEAQTEGLVALSVGEYGRAAEAFQRAASLKEHMGRAAGLSLLYYLAAKARRRDGEAHGSLALLDEASRLSAAHREPVVHALCWCEHGMLAIGRGESPHMHLQNARELAAALKFTASSLLVRAIMELEAASR